MSPAGPAKLFQSRDSCVRILAPLRHKSLELLGICAPGVRLRQECVGRAYVQLQRFYQTVVQLLVSSRWGNPHQRASGDPKGALAGAYQLFCLGRGFRLAAERATKPAQYPSGLANDVDNVSGQL